MLADGERTGVTRTSLMAEGASGGETGREGEGVEREQRCEERGEGGQLLTRAGDDDNDVGGSEPTALGRLRMGSGQVSSAISTLDGLGSVDERKSKRAHLEPGSLSAGGERGGRAATCALGQTCVWAVRTRETIGLREEGGRCRDRQRAAGREDEEAGRKKEEAATGGRINNAAVRRHRDRRA
jgi:hypothetical protein